MKGNTVNNADASRSSRSENDDPFQNLRDVANDQIWAKFFNSYSPLVFAFARRQGVRFCDAHDIVQETFRVVIGKVTSETHLSRAEFEHWLIAVARNKIFDLVRRRHLAEKHEPESEHWTEDPLMASEREHLFLAVLMFVEELQAHCTKADFAAFTTSVVMGEPTEQAAKLLNKTKRAVYVSVSKVRCLARLRAERLRELQSSVDQ